MSVIARAFVVCVALGSLPASTYAENLPSDAAASDAAASEPTAASVSSPASPSHDELVARVKARVDEGAFAEANVLLDTALGRERFTREELAELLVLRALLAYADERLGLLEESLFALAELVPDLDVVELPPPVRARFAEVRAVHRPIVLNAEVVTEIVEGERRGRPVVTAQHDAGRLIRRIAIRAAAGDAPLRLLGPDETLSLGGMHEPARVRVAFEAYGLGDALVARLGSVDAPSTLEIAPIPRDRTFRNATIITVAAFLVVAAIAFGFAWIASDGFTRGQDTTLGSVRCCDP